MADNYAFKYTRLEYLSIKYQGYVLYNLPVDFRIGSLHAKLTQIFTEIFLNILKRFNILVMKYGRRRFIGSSIRICKTTGP
ncbi:MAG TPA: hypothetical protein PKI84_02735 [Methanofastidiosum sp.]|mgnify:FL=1|jgi:hypothetical protein|nr:hypothetical protein [Methanofastidiosum sp.]